ncbi:MAG: hydrogenase maturation nickel metallochaperone HypA [Planctomycetota bacterium]|nr:MAG: hydrogenase maturation nickel metallochaperone HypA [Planctomycetota bacterium]
MHERSLMKALLAQVDAIRVQHRAQKVSEVRVEVGPLSGVEPVQLATAFEEMALGTPCATAAFIIDEVGLLARCLDCHTEFEVVGFEFLCPECAGQVQVICGDSLQLISVGLELEHVAKEETT